MEKERSRKISLVDCHAHLDELDDLSEALQEAKTTGVRGIIAVGVNVESNKRILQIAKANQKFVYPAFGYHPWEMREEEVKEKFSFIQSKHLTFRK